MPDAYADPLVKITAKFPQLDVRPRLLYEAGGKHDLDEPVRLAADSASVQTRPSPIKVRIQPAIFFHSTKQYKGWAAVSWIFECWRIDQAIRFRKDLGKFIEEWIEKERARK